MTIMVLNLYVFLACLFIEDKHAEHEQHGTGPHQRDGPGVNCWYYQNTAAVLSRLH